MAIEYKRLIVKQSDTASEVATIPTTNDHTDGTWLSTDIYKGELFINTVDDVIQTRTDNGIISVGGGGSTSDTLLPSVDVTASRPLVLTDRDKILQTTEATATTLTIPTNADVAFPIGTQIMLTQFSTGQLDVVGDTGVTVYSANGYLKANVQYSGLSLVKKETNGWYLFGDLKS